MLQSLHYYCYKMICWTFAGLLLYASIGIIFGTMSVTALFRRVLGQFSDSLLASFVAVTTKFCCVSMAPFEMHSKGKFSKV